MKYYTVILEGIDKTGKDQLARYIDQICGHKYCLPRRGIVSNIAYAKLFGREIPEYELRQHDHELYVLLRASDRDDWKLRCTLSGETPINYTENCDAFESTWKWFKENRDPKLCLEFDTSLETPITIARKISDYLDNLNNGKL